MILFSNQKDVVVLISVQLPKFCLANAFGNRALSGSCLSSFQKIENFLPLGVRRLTRVEILGKSCAAWN